MTKSEIINNYINLFAKFFDITADNYKTLKYLNLKGERDLDRILDCKFLLQDTQLAKENIKKFGLCGRVVDYDDGELYLRVYGFFNACYIQKEVIETLDNLLGLVFDKKINNENIFKFRAYFASHGSNIKDSKEKIRKSFLLSRPDLRKNIISGYSSNDLQNIHFIKKEKVENLMSLWDDLLEKELQKILKKIIIDKNIELLDKSLISLKRDLQKFIKLSKNKNIINIIEISKEQTLTIKTIL